MAVLQTILPVENMQNRSLSDPSSSPVENKKETEMNSPLQFIIPAIGFVVTVASGFWLGKIGRPYNGILFNIHKLIALGTVVITSFGVYKVLGDLEVQSLILVLIVLAALGVIASFASGAFLSIGNPNYRITKVVHNAAPVVAVGMIGYTIYLLG